MTKLLCKIMLVVFAVAAFAEGDGVFNGERFVEEDWSGDKKSTIKAAALSLLIPGAGEIYLGETKSAIPFLVVDGVIWAFAAGFGTYGTWRGNEYRTFAQKYAGADIDGKDDEFFRMIGLYPDRDTYNYILLLNERDRSLLLDETPQWFWQWRCEEDQLKYYDLWTSSEHAWQRFKVTLAAAGINRLISVINVMRISRTGVPIWNLSLSAYPRSEKCIGMSLNLQRKF